MTRYGGGALRRASKSSCSAIVHELLTESRLYSNHLLEQNILSQLLNLYRVSGSAVEINFDWRTNCQRTLGG